MNLNDAPTPSHYATAPLVEEARVLFDGLKLAVFCIEKLPDDPDTIKAIFDTAHALKDSAGLFGLDHIVDFTHVVESLVTLMRNHTPPFTADHESILPEVIGQLRVLLDVLVVYEIAEHFDQVDEFTPIAETVLGVAGREKLRLNAGLKATLRAVLAPMRRLMNVLLCEFARSFEAPAAGMA